MGRPFGFKLNKKVVRGPNKKVKYGEDARKYEPTLEEL
jgi:hypothetical protein